MVGQGRMLGQILIEMQIISNQQLEAALTEQSQSGKKLGQILVQLGIISELQLMETLAYMLGIPRVRISNIDIDMEAVKLVSPGIIKQYKLMPLCRSKGSITVAMADPLNQQAIDDTRMSSGLEVIPLIASAQELEIAIQQYITFNTDPNMEQLIDEFTDKHVKSSERQKRDLHLVNIDYDAPIIRMVNTILTQAVQGSCSDIHIEPQETNTRVRFRLDGELYEVMTLPHSTEAAIISRIKIMAGMDIAEKRIPQDGRFRMEFDNREVDFRVSTLPAFCGEKMVLRILDRNNVITQIEHLGLSFENRRKMLFLSHRWFGMILITGPTGSGKTTTLYSILSEVNFMNKNIITLEDPVEYALAGINQVQINPKAGLGFARGLRSILRQDPDVIMLGEIRDQETAKMAVQAALTGHLMISTLHTNSAAGALARLSDMGVEKYLISAALSGVVAQRLVRKLCPNCRIEYILDKETADTLNQPELAGHVFYRPGGCNMCRQSGYTGRMALHEILLVGSRIKTLIYRGITAEDTIQDTAIEEGMKTILEDGIGKACEGHTSLEEVIKTVLLEGEDNGCKYNGHIKQRNRI
ncbi:type iv fimbrial assembly, atpase pilb [hydrocarbon metagenome]|uniref:Type iv fimbrial assembly, atpase pilb n=1 Tax=hydrocarbon metagenome TaxID=938273 RepID=A0A0W8E8U2_9ZZZZ